MLGFAHVPLPLTLESPRGNQDTLYSGLFRPKSFSWRKVRLSQKPTDQHKIHFKDSESGECLCTHLHTNALCVNVYEPSICLNRDEASDSGVLTHEQEVVCSLFLLIWANSLHFPVID